MASIDDITPGTYAIDVSHSSVAFVARHLMIAKTRGRFTSFDGTIVIGENRLDSSVDASIDLASVDTGDDKRDAHLRSPDFFDVERFPTMSFRSTGVKQDGGQFVLSGDLSLRGVTLPVELELEFDGTSPDPWGGSRVAFTAETELNRKDFGLEWNVALETGGVLVGDKVKVQLEIEAVKQ